MPRSIATNTVVARADLLEFVRPRHRMILLTYRRDGSPQLSPVTAGVDAEGRVVIATYPGRAKTVNLKRNSRCSLLVLSEEFNDPFVQLDGTAEVLDLPPAGTPSLPGGPPPDALEPLVDYFRAISGEHPDWDEYRAAMRLQGKSLLRITVERWGPVATGGFPAGVAARLDG